MKIVITAIGKQIKTWMQEGIDAYLKRMPNNFNVVINTVAPYKTNQKNAVLTIKAKEAEKLLGFIKPHEYVIALDETGKQFTTSQWHQNIKKIANDDTIHFIIGGAYGLDASIQSRANTTWSLGKITLPHGLARLVLIEQLYRVNCLLNNHPYHKV